MTRMFISKKSLTRTQIIIVALSCSCGAISTQAAPYASSLSNNAGVISFRLNEAADNVKVISNGGAVTNDLGALPAGLNQANLGIAGVFQVQARKGGAGTIRTNSATIPFNSPTGVAVNKNPSSPAFGRVYVANSIPGTKGDGIFVFNADLSDTFGQGDSPRTGGLDFSTGTGASPYRLTVGENDNQLYIADWSDSTGNLYVTDPDVAVGSFALQPLTGTAAVPVTTANNHGSVAAAIVIGSTATADMTIYIVDEDLASDRDSGALTEMNSLWRIPVGSGPLPSDVFDPGNKLLTPSVNFVSQVMDLAHGPNGYLYLSQYRSAGAQAGVYVVDPAVGVITNTFQISQALGSSADILLASGGVAVSPDGVFLAVINQENNVVTVVTLNNGIPDLNNRIQFTGLGAGVGTATIRRDLAFDAANNLYVVGTRVEFLQALSLDIPTTATTGSDGTFTLDDRFITISATEPNANETGPTPGIITVTRHGSTNEALTVNLTISGSASNTTDYATLPTSITFAPGQSTTNLLVTPVDDPQPEINETVVLTLTASTNYTFFNSSATVTIIDNDAPLVNISTDIPTMYERVPGDFVRFRISRGGDIANSSLAVNLAYSGTATDGVDYFGSTTTVFMNNGEGSVTFLLNPQDDSDVEGDETIVVSIVPDPSYIIGTASNAVATILDDEFAPENPIFSDNFESDTTSSWSIKAGASDGVQDYHAVFNYDYAAKGIPAAPGDFTSSGLITTANKADAVVAGAGVNAYPIGQTFSGDYALRFQMFIEGIIGAGTTEHVIFGINHSGTKTNFALRQTTGSGFLAATPGGGDGIWFNIVADSSLFPGGSDYGAFVSVSSPPTILASRLATSLTNVFKAPPYRFAGTPASTTLGLRQTWADVEVRQISNVITLSINKSQILSFTNTTGFTSGSFMLGYNDAFGSIGGGVGNTGPSIDSVLSGFVVYDNVRVISLAPFRVTKTEVVGGNLVIQFTDSNAGPFTVQQSNVVTGPYNDIAATIIQLGPTLHQATVPFSAGNPHSFYQIKR